MKALNFAACCGLLLAAPATAQSGTQPEPAQAVSTRDLDLATARGQKELDRRIQVASRDVCGIASSADATGYKKVRLCRAAAAKNAMGKRQARLADAPTLTSTRTASLNRE
jgi:UrcA family protein